VLPVPQGEVIDEDMCVLELSGRYGSGIQTFGTLYEEKGKGYFWQERGEAVVL